MNERKKPNECHNSCRDSSAGSEAVNSVYIKSRLIVGQPMFAKSTADEEIIYLYKHIDG